MRSFTVFLVIAAFAVARGSHSCRKRSQNDDDEGSSPRHVLKIYDRVSGKRIGQLHYCNYGNTAAFIHGDLKGFPIGTYVGLAHHYGNFNGSCSSAGPILKSSNACKKNEFCPQHYTVGFTPATVTSRNSKVTDLYSQDLYLGRNNRKFSNGHLIVVYPLPPNGVPFHIVPEEKRVLPPPMACGVIKRQGPLEVGS